MNFDNYVGPYDSVVVFKGLGFRFGLGVVGSV